MAIKKNKSRDISNPLEIWMSWNGEWEWRVLQKKSDLIWECAVKSPHTFGSWEYGAVYSSRIIQNGARTFVDPPLTFFEGARPERAGTDISIPDPRQPGTLLPPDAFAFLCRFFTENDMSYHTADARGELCLFLSMDADGCSAALKEMWGIGLDSVTRSEICFDLLVFDQPEDPLHVPYSFMLANGLHRHELTRLVEQEALPFYMLTVREGELHFVARRLINLTDEVRLEMSSDINEALVNSAA